MIISEKLNNEYKNQIKIIKQEKVQSIKMKLIGALVADVGGNCINSISKVAGVCWRTVKKAYSEYTCGKQLKMETRGRKKSEEKYPQLITQVKEIVQEYENTDPHFRTEKLYVDLTLGNLRKELINKYNYSEQNCPCKNTLSRILKKLGYKIRKVKKKRVQSKVPETDAIFENVNETKKFALKSDDTVAAISIDDKARKKIGNVSDNGYSWFEREALDHDTFINCTINPFGILDLKTNKTFVYCTKGSSTADFKVDCIENYLKEKLKNYNLKRLIIFLDNGPENSSRRTLWRKRLIELAIKYNIVIELAYYPPYHSKYNMIERYWARLQLSWNGIIIDTTEELLNVINKVTWKGVKTVASFVKKEYEKKITIDEYEMNRLDKKHVYREEYIEKWSVVITP